jgi:hypothetical protein
MANDPHRVLVALCAAGDGIPTAIVGIPEAAWKHCQNGKTHTVDLVPSGIPVRLVIFGGKDHAELNEWLKAHDEMVDDEVPQDLPILGEDTDIKPH